MHANVLNMQKVKWRSATSTLLKEFHQWVAFNEMVKKKALQVYLLRILILSLSWSAFSPDCNTSLLNVCNATHLFVLWNCIANKAIGPGQWFEAIWIRIGMIMLMSLLLFIYSVSHPIHWEGHCFPYSLHCLKKYFIILQFSHSLHLL